MNRLTERDAFGDPNIPGLPGEQTYRAIMNALNKLAEYEDAEEEGRLVMLPCKVGDMVYSTISLNGNKLEKCEPNTVSYITVFENQIVISVNDYYTKDVYPHDIGKTVFLTREEAEKAIKIRDRNGKQYTEKPLKKGEVE